jgi:deoxyribodipyrimidine photo-lyase
MAPLRVPEEWCRSVGKALEGLKVPLEQVDAHNVVPVWLASDKREVGARTIRPRITKLLPEFLTDFPALKRQQHAAKKGGGKKPFDLQAVLKSVTVDRRVGPVAQFKPGAVAGRRQLDDFVKKRLKIFSTLRNNPNKEALSGLSPWIHFGQISAQRCALVVKAAGAKLSADFIEEAVIRRELADNFCFYTKDYDSLKGAAGWAVESLQKHAKDKREYVYTRSELEAAKTHDNLWNAAQRQLVDEGKMHGFLRMYWAKKVLEWTKTPEEALATTIYLNDRYSIDGRDPNGYVGCMWSVCGIHDMGWTERPIFGKIRYMNYKGCTRKFNVPEFEQRYAGDASSQDPATSQPPAKKRRRS